MNITSLKSVLQNAILFASLNSYASLLVGIILDIFIFNLKKGMKRILHYLMVSQIGSLLVKVLAFRLGGL